MRKAQKQQAEELVRQMEEAHDQIKKFIEQGSIPSAMELLEECQNGGITLGTLIENTEGQGHPTVLLLEEYCELTYQIHEDLAINKKDTNTKKRYKLLRQKLIKISNSIKNDIRIKIEVAFFSYKASMWDSLESVYLAAKEDPDCDAYCVPIPYYDLNPDRSFGQMHYEGDQYPNDIEIVDWQKYNFEERKPDVIFIHNIYDNYNLVTSVHPRYYSGNLKQYTDQLVYIPYYMTSGGMSEGQGFCPSYMNADYIVIQSPKFRDYFDVRIPNEKFLPFGSPKADRVIRKCQNLPVPPKEWQEKMAGKKVYFYNTSIGGMLADTENFLKKMQYVFNCFEGRDDVCILWRPHPLLEATFHSMRPEYWSVFEKLRNQFVEKGIGILDTSADIEDSIALSDAYIGDSGTSVTALFGVAGKPLFILNNCIHTLPQDDDWRGEKIVLAFDLWGNDRYQVTGNNQLWFSENNDYHYKFYMNLVCGYSGGTYYQRAVEIGDSVYVLPCNAQDLLIVRNKEIRKIEFKRQIKTEGAFCGCLYDEKYIFLFPYQYPQVIRFNIETEDIQYIDGIKQFYIREINGKKVLSGSCIYENEIVFGSPADSEFLFMNKDTLEIRYLRSNSAHNFGTLGFVQDPYENDLWIVPLKGYVITRWNPKTGETKEYGDVPIGYKSIRWPDETECDEQPFGMIAFSRESGKENIVISPSWGNMYLTVDRQTGKMKPWSCPVGVTSHGKNEYFLTCGASGFIIPRQQRGKAKCKLWHAPERKLYEINIDTKECKEIKIEFDYDELREHESGFADESEWKRYCIKESAFNSLDDFLNDRITGNRFNKEQQINSYATINVNINGTCGVTVYNFIKEKLEVCDEKGNYIRNIRSFS